MVTDSTARGKQGLTFFMGSMQGEVCKALDFYPAALGTFRYTHFCIDLNLIELQLKAKMGVDMPHPPKRRHLSLPG